MYSYEVAGKELIVKHGKDAMVVWKGKPEGYAVNTVLPIPGEDNCIVLCEYVDDSPVQFHNLFRLTPHGDIVWSAELPGVMGSDAYVHVEITNNGLEANTWSGMRVRIDLRNGKVLESSYTK